MYTIYAIQVNTSSPADPTSTVLQNCASSTDKFFMLTSSTQILTTFQTIGTALSKLRVAQITERSAISCNKKAQLAPGFPIGTNGHDHEAPACRSECRR